MWKPHPALRKPDDAGEGGSEGGAGAQAPAASPAPAAGAPTPAGSPAAASPPPVAGSPASSSPPPAGTPPPKPEDTKPTWPADWRETVSKGDAKLLARFQRYASPEAAMDALVAAQNRISSGELKPVLAKNATPEQLAEWRAANGIPEKAEGYDFGKDFKLREEAQAFLERYLPIAHSANMTPEQVKANLKFMDAVRVDTEADRAKKDIELQSQYEEELRAEWGAEFKANMGFIHATLDGATSPQFKEALLGARLADGTPVGSSPDMLRFLMSLALIQNPAGTLVPGYHANPAEGVESEIAKIEEDMRKNRPAYNKDEKKQARYRELIAAREKMKATAS